MIEIRQGQVWADYGSDAGMFKVFMSRTMTNSAVAVEDSTLWVHAAIPGLGEAVQYDDELRFDVTGVELNERMRVAVSGDGSRLVRQFERVQGCTVLWQAPGFLSRTLLVGTCFQPELIHARHVAQAITANGESFLRIAEPTAGNPVYSVYGGTVIVVYVPEDDALRGGILEGRIRRALTFGF
jgi:hypothetical protein